MEYHAACDPRSGCYTVRFSGLVLPNDLIEMLKALWVDPGYAAARQAVWDFGACETDYRFQDIFALFKFVQENKVRRGPRMLAVIAPRDMEFGMSRMYASLGDDCEPVIKVFRSGDEARGWLLQQSPG